MTSICRAFPLLALFFNLPAIAAQPGLPGDRLFGEWKLTECEYWRDGKPIANRECVVRGDFRTVFLPGSIVTQTLGQEKPPVTIKVSYTDAAETVDGLDTHGVVRQYNIVSPTAIWYFTHNKALDLDVRVTLGKVSDLPPQLLAPAVSTSVVASVPPQASTQSPEPSVQKITNPRRQNPGEKVEKPDFPEEFLGDWGPEKWDCYSSVILSIEPKRIGIGSAGDWDYFGDVNTCFTCEGGVRYEGKVVWLIPNFNRKGVSPFVVYLNAGEKKGEIKIEFFNPELKKRYASPFKTKLKRCR